MLNDNELEEVEEEIDIDEEDMIEGYKILNNSECNDDDRNYAFSYIQERVDAVLSKLIPKGITYQKYLRDEQFLEDKLNEKLSELIIKCWESEYEKRISHEEIDFFLSETAKKVLTPEDLKKYQDYCEKIFEVKNMEQNLELKPMFKPHIQQVYIRPARHLRRFFVIMALPLKMMIQLQSNNSFSLLLLNEAIKAQHLYFFKTFDLIFYYKQPNY